MQARTVSPILFMATLLAATCQAQIFTIAGYEALDRPGVAHLVLRSNQTWAEQALRVEISGALAGVLLYDTVEEVTDLGYLPLEAGNYTIDIYVLENLGATVEQSGAATAHETVEFSIPAGPEPQPEDEPIVTSTNLGFMILGLFVFGLVLAIWRTTRRPKISKPELEGAGEAGE